MAGLQSQPTVMLKNEEDGDDSDMAMDTNTDENNNDDNSSTPGTGSTGYMEFRLSHTATSR